MIRNIHLTAGTAKYILKEPNASRDTPIIFDYSFGRGNRLKCSTGYKILPKLWDAKNQRIRAVSDIANREQVNKRLKEIQSSFITMVSEMDPTLKQDKRTLRKIFLDIKNGGVQKSRQGLPDFFTYADRFVHAKEKQFDTTKTNSLSKITIRAYKQTIKKLRAYDKETDFKLDFDTINLEFYYSLIHYLEDQDYSLNTIGKHLKNLIAILNRATEDGINTNLAYKHREFRRVSENTTSIYLTTEEIEKLEKKNLSGNLLQQGARDIFLIGYYTGQRVSDYNGLTNNNIKKFEGQEVFEIKQKKTSKTVYIPIHPKLQAMFKKRYKGKLPPKMPEPLINKHIKDVAQSVKINEEIVTIKTKGGEKETKAIKKCKLIGTHTARRSFCTNAYLSKMPVIDIMALSGHTTEKEFYKYIKVTPQERAVKIADSAFFK
jgi:integrase